MSKSSNCVPIRIMHVVDSMGKGGLENGLANLIERFDPHRFHHIVYAMRHLGHNADRLPREHVEVICLGKKDTGAKSQLLNMVRAIREYKPDIVHSRNWAAIEAVLAARLTGTRAIVHSEHGFDADENAKEPWRRICFRRLAFELADTILCVSNQLRQAHASRIGFPPNRISVIHNGVDTGRFFPDPAARARLRNELGILDSEFCIGSIGNLTPVKDQMTLLRAINRFATECRDWRLIFWGIGPERSDLEAFVQAHPEWSPRVSFLGLSNRIPEILNALDLYVLTSLTEGICNSLLEAMATCLPVLVTSTGGNPEVVLDGISGLLFPVRDFQKLSEQLRLLRHQPDLRRQIAQQGLLRVREHFSMAAMVRNYEELYGGLLERS